MINRIKRFVRDFVYRVELRKQIQALGGFAPLTDTTEMLQYRKWRLERVGCDRFDMQTPAGKLATWFAVSESTAQFVHEQAGSEDAAAKVFLYAEFVGEGTMNSLEHAPGWFRTPEGLRHWFAWQVCAPMPAAWRLLGVRMIAKHWRTP